MANYKEENNKYYRQAFDGSWFEVKLNSDGNFTWTQPDGQKVKDTTFIVPHGMQKGKNPLGGTSYRVPTGTNGSFGTYYNFMDAVNAYNKAYDRGAFADPSENILNDAMAGGTSLLRNGAIKGATKGLYDNVRQIATAIAQQGAKETVKKAGNVIVKKVVPTVVGGVIGGTVVDAGSKVLTGKTWGENVSNGLTQHYGINVPTIVGDMTNPGYALGGWSTNRGINWAKKKRFNKQNSSTIKRPISPEEKAGIPKHERKTKSPYTNLGDMAITRENTSVNNPRFGKIIGDGSEQTVFEDLTNPNQVLKVYDSGRYFKSIDEIKQWHPKWFKRNQIPLQLPMKFEGYVTHKYGISPVYSQQKVNPIGNMTYDQYRASILPKLQHQMKSLGFTGDGVNAPFKFNNLTLDDMSTNNMGYDNSGNLRFFDVDVFKRGGRIWVRT